MKIFLKNDRTRFGFWRTLGRVVLLLILILLVPVSYILPRLLIRDGAADYYCANVFPKISMIPGLISGAFLFSLTELFVVVGVLTLVVLIVIFVIHSIKLAVTVDVRHMLHFIYKVLKAVAITGIAGALIFEFMHGINYNRTSVRKTLHLYGETRPFEDYEQTLIWAYTGMTEARRQLGEDYNGVAHLRTDYETCVYDANIALNTVDHFYGLGLSGNYIHAKPVWLSRLWGYTEITGVYDPFLGESNINTDYLDILHFPITLCHEIAHAKGYASETDANTLAVLSCINSSRADFRYAGYYYIFIRLWGTVNDYAANEGQAMIDYASEADMAMVMRDMNAYDEYMESFNTGPIADLIAHFSEDVNNAFLESNGQEGGTDTYVVPQNAYVEYFCRYIRDA